MTKNKKKLRRAERRYSVTKSAQTLVLAGMLLAGGVTGAMAAGTAYNPTGNFAVDTEYNSTTGGPADTVVVSKNGVIFNSAGTVTISAPEGLKIDGTAASSGADLKVGTASNEILTITSGALTLTAGDTTTANDATLTIDGAGAEVRLVADDGEAVIAGSVAEGGAGLNKVTVTSGTLGAYMDADKSELANLTINGPVGVTIAGSNAGILAAAGLTLADAATLTNGNTLTVDGVGGNNKAASLWLLDGSTYAGHVTVDAEISSPELPALFIANSTITGYLTVTAGDVLLQGATTGDVTMTGGFMDIESTPRDEDSDTTTMDSDKTTMASLDLSGGTVTVGFAELDVTGLLTISDADAQLTLYSDATLKAGSLEMISGFVELQGKADIRGTSKITGESLLWVSGETTMTDKLTVGDARTPGGSVAVLSGGTLHLKEDSTTAGSGHLEVREGGTLKLDADKTLTVAGIPVDSPSAGMGRNVVLYDASGFENDIAGKCDIAGKVDVTSGELAFATAVDLTDILINGDTSNATNGKITIGADGSDAGEVAARQGLTYKKDALALGHKDATLMSGNFQLGAEDTVKFDMKKGTLTAIGELRVGDGTGTLDLSGTNPGDATLNLIQASSETKTVQADKIHVDNGIVNVLLGKWEVKDIEEMGMGGQVNVGQTDLTKGGEAGLTINGLLDTAFSGAVSGAVKVINGNLTLAGTVDLATDSITVSDLGQVSTKLSTAYDLSSKDLATGFATVEGTGLLTLSNDTQTKEMTLADYKTLTSKLQSSTGGKVGVTVEGLTITGTEGATLDGSPATGGVNVEGVSLLGVVAKVTDTAVALDGDRTDLKGLAVDNAGNATTITLGNSNAATLTLKGGAKGFDLDSGGIADMVLENDSILNLGTVGDKTYGDLSGDVTLSSATATLNAVNGEFSVGAVEATTANQGAVKAQSAFLTVKSIGATNKAVGSVESNADGTLYSLGGITTDTLTANSGWVQAVDDIKVTDKVTGLNDGAIWSITGDVTLTAGAENASGRIEATKGDITTAGNASITGTDLTLYAGTEINVGTGNIEAKNVATGGKITAKEITATNLTAKTLTTTATTGNVALTDGILFLTGKGAEASTVGGTLILKETKSTVGELTVTDTVAIGGGSFTGEKVTFNGGVGIANGAQVGITNLTLGASLEVGEDDLDAKGGTSLQVNTLNLAGHSLLLDPDWGLASTEVAVGSFSDNTSTPDLSINGDVGVGKNSMLTVGTTDKAWLREQLNAVTNGAGLTENGVTAVMGLKTAQVLGTGSKVLVDGSMDLAALGTALTSASNTATFAEGSLLIVNAAGLDGKAALTAATTGTVSIADTAKLRVTGVQSGNAVKILDNFTVSTGITAGKGWSEKAGNLSTDSHMLYGELNVDSTGKTITVDIKAHEAQSMFPKLSSGMAGLVNGFYAQGLYDVESRNAGIKFMSRATNTDMMPNTDQAAATIEGAAQLAVVGAAPAMTLSAVQAGTSTVTTRTSFASPLMDSSKAVALHKDVDGTLSVDSGLSAGNGMKNGFGLWIMPLYQSNSAWGMKADGFKGGYKSDLGGVALGADYTFNDMFRLGLAFNIGGGYAESNGDFNKTENSFNFWGINAYGGWTMNNFGITADVGYTGNYNKLQQELPSGMGMSDIKSDVNSSAWTAGLRGEYKFATEALDIIPHVGVRYTGLTTDEYKAKSGGDTVFKVDQDFQSIWTFPIGVTLAKEIETGSGWIIRPQVDLGITPATGDVKAKSKVRIPGVDAQAEMKMQVVDYMSYDGGLGLEMKKDNVSFGINYNIQASEHRTGHGVFGTFRYEF